MQQLPPFPDDNPGFPPDPAPPEQPQPSQPGEPSHAPAETPPIGPDIDVPAPANPGTQPSPTPISPTGGTAIA